MPTFDLANVYNAAANIHGAQSQNALMQQKLEQQNALAQKNAQFNPLLQEYLAGNENVLNQMYALNPEATAKVTEFQQTQNELARQKEQEDAQRVVRYSQFVLDSKNPKQILQTAFPEYTQALADQGVDVESLTDDQVKQMAQGLIEYYGPRADMGPTDVYGAPDRTLVEIADSNSPTGTTYVPRSDAIGQPGKPPSGMSVTVGPDGTVQLTQGRGVSGMQKPTTTQIEKDILTTQAALQRVNTIAQGFRPEFQQIGTRLGTAWTAIREKLGNNPSETDRQILEDFSLFKRDALANISQTIKDLTGAAMSQAEAKRIMATAPNPGDGIFNGDSPTEFEAKMQGVIRNLNQVKARLNYARKNGLDFSSIPLDGVERIMTSREQELKALGMDDAEIERRMRQEFGL